MRKAPAYEGREDYLFVSYAHADSAVVMPVVEALFADKYRLWYDEGIAPGSEWPKNIETHLQNAAAVLVFVSAASLASPNCENEVREALKAHPIFACTLDGKEHPLLKNCTVVKSAEELRQYLPGSLLGDGISGYGAVMEAENADNPWSRLTLLGIALMIALGVGIYGLFAGWFDRFLPGLQDMQAPILSEPAAEQVNIGGILGQAIAGSVGKEELLVQIPSELDWLIQALPVDETPETYLDLTRMDSITALMLDCAQTEDLQCLQYLPNLEKLTIGKGAVNIESLAGCPKLKEVYLGNNVFPVEIPTGLSYRIFYTEANE